MKRLFRIILILTCLVAPLVITSVTQAIGPPAGDPTVSQLHVNCNLIAEDDGTVLFYGIYDIPYGTSLPTEPASDTYVFRLFDGDDELGMIVPFVLFNKGYNKGVFSFFFTEFESWEEVLIIRISQNPAYFDTPESWNYEVPFSAYTSKTTKAENQVELTINIISMAQYLESYLTGYTLLEDSPGGTILSSPTGETYFRGAIYGIQLMAPSLFLVQILETDVEGRKWKTEKFDEYTERFDPTWVGEQTKETANQFGLTTGGIMALIFILPVCIGAIIVSSIKWKKAEPGFVFTFVALTMGVVMGWFPGAIYAALLQLMAIYIAYLWFYARG